MNEACKAVTKQKEKSCTPGDLVAVLERCIWRKPTEAEASAIKASCEERAKGAARYSTDVIAEAILAYKEFHQPHRGLEKGPLHPVGRGWLAARTRGACRSLPATSSLCFFAFLT